MRSRLSFRTYCVLFCSLLTISLSYGPPARGQQLTAPVKKLPQCSLPKTNTSCRLTIDRGNPVTPPTLQMYSDQRLTVIVKHPKPFERYFLDFQTAQATLTPDVAANIVQGLTSSLGSIKGIVETRSLPRKPLPAEDCRAVSQITLVKDHLEDAIPTFQKCLALLYTDAIGIYRSLEPWIAPNSLVPSQTQPEDLTNIQKDITDFLTSEFALSDKITLISSSDQFKGDKDVPARQRLATMQKSADAVASDLIGYSQRITDLKDPGLKQAQGFQNCEDLVDLTADEKKEQNTEHEKLQCVSITSIKDNDKTYANMVTRTVTYYLDSLNLISNSQTAAEDPTKKVLLASIAVTFGDKPVGKRSLYSALRWEPSAGVFFSTLAIRSFSVAPIFANKVVTDSVVQESDLHPTAVPFAAANYRLTNYFAHTRWNSALYWTAAVGVNPNTVSADFASGFSISWRTFMLSPLWHYGHDVTLDQGFQPNEHLGASFTTTLPTHPYWRSSFAVGISVRIPSLTGR